MTENVNQVRVAVVGLGQGLLDVYVALKHPRVKLVAVCDADPAPYQWIIEDKPFDESALFPFRVDWLRCIRAIPERQNVEYVPDYAALLARSDIDAIALVVPNAAHEPLTVQALAAGKYALCTKPMADTIESAIRIAAAAREHPGRYMLGFQLTYSPFAQILEQIIDSGKLGELRQLRFDYHREPWPPNRRRKDAAVDGAMLREGTHWLDLIYRLNGQRPWTSIAGFGATDRFTGSLEFEDNGTVMLNYDGFRAIHSYSHIRHARPAPEDFLLVGEQGTVRGTFGQLRLETDQDMRVIDVPGPTLPHEFNIGYHQMYDEFARMCLDGTEPYSGWESALENMLTCHAAQRAVAENRTITRTELRHLDWREE